jgi:hypothetical protein
MTAYNPFLALIIIAKQYGFIMKPAGTTGTLLVNPTNGDRLTIYHDCEFDFTNGTTGSFGTCERSPKINAILALNKVLLERQRGER